MSLTDEHIPTRDEILTDIWQRLSDSADQAGKAWGVPVLSNQFRGEPTARSVVLRAVDSEQRKLFAFTDARSPKVAQLREHSAAIWTFYDPVGRIQLIAHTEIEVKSVGADVDHFWNSSRPESLHCYLGEDAPGTKVDTPSVVPTMSIQLHDLAGGRENFAVLEATIKELDWLALRRSGNLRARFHWTGEDWDFSWLVP
ncbi:MAG: hypothetical protein H6824_08270 [Planctomycetaceae bacterium]|nr:hypothetical protein [Planctomycetaceae bacterium]